MGHKQDFDVTYLHQVFFLYMINFSPIVFDFEL